VTVPPGVQKYGALIEPDAVEDARVRNDLPASYSRSDTLRYCIARAAGLDHFDALREAQKLGRRTLDPKVDDDGMASVTVYVPEDLLTQCMEMIGTKNRSHAVRVAIGEAANRADLIERADRGPRGRKPKSAK
jgi:hypothetical protein